ncbi:MAG: hypothetical protein H8D23_22785 [Candidatus Brocadiales bacterium]|nr:hypothetical protein [Candidatus Brocadiales bacterium]
MRSTRFFIFIFIAGLLFPNMQIFSNHDNLQKIYKTDSVIYQIISSLSVEQGFSPPSSAGPWSGAELLTMLSRITSETLSYSSKALYNWVSEQLSTPEKHSLSSDFGYTSIVDLTGELYFHINSGEHFNEEDEWIRNYTTRSPLLSIPFEFWGNNLFYGTLDLSLQNNRSSITPESTSAYFEPYTTTNLIVDIDENNIDLSFPWRAFLSIGDNNWSIQFGRDIISWGNGVSGNLMIGDHLNYHEFFRFSTFFDPFKYTFLAISFPHPDLYQRPPNLPEDDDWSALRASISSIRTFIAHRYEFLLAPQLRVSLSEAMMYQGETYDFRYFSPFVILHNYYMKENANSILSLEIDYTLLRSLLIHGQFVIDDLSIGNERTSGDKTQPNAWGALGGLHYVKTVNSGILQIILEGVYTTPYLYLRNSRVYDFFYLENDPNDEDRDQNAQPIDFVVGYPQYTQSVGNVVKEEFLGYEYGGDAIVLNFVSAYTKPDAWEIHCSLFWMLHGTFDADTPYELGDAAVSMQTPTVSPPEMKHSETFTTDKNSVETTFIVSIGGSYHITPKIKLSVDLGWVTRWNPGNIASLESASDFQGSVGLAVSL